MASALQLPREELIRAYRQMRTIREFEDTVHDEFSAGSIPGFVHLYAGEEASGVGVCMHLDDRDVIASTHRGHGHCIAKGCDIDGMMQEIFGRARRPVRRQGRLDAHRRPLQGHARRERHRRGRRSAGLRRGADREDAEDRRRGGLLSSATAAPTRAPFSKATIWRRSGTCRRSSSSRTTAMPSRPRAAIRSAASQVGPRTRLRHCPRPRSTVRTSLPSTRRRERRSSAPARAAAPASSIRACCATTAISRATRRPIGPPAKSPLTRLRRIR